MLKYLSYSNLFLGIIFIAILNTNKNYLDLALILPAVFFNWITLFHFIKNNLRFEKWHLYAGFLSVIFFFITIILTLQIAFGLFSTNALVMGPQLLLVVFRLLFDFCIFFQFILAYKANINLQNLIQGNK